MPKRYKWNHIKIKLRNIIEKLINIRNVKWYNKKLIKYFIIRN